MAVSGKVAQRLLKLNRRRSMKAKFIALASLLCLVTLLFGQDPSTFEAHKKILKDRCTGGSTGNGTFNTRLSSLEQILLSKTTKKTFDKTLPHFVDEGTVTFSYNEATKKHDLPNYEIHYTLLKNGQIDKSLGITISNSIDGYVSMIYLYNINSLSADTYIDELKKRGYIFRESLSNRSTKKYFNKSKNIHATISRRMDGGFNLELLKI